MNRLLRLLRVLLFQAAVLAGAGPALAAAGAVVTTEQVRAELLAHAPEGVGPNKPLWLGLAIDHQPHWHTYWKNPGDSGLPTTMSWRLPPGVTAGPIDWPAPKKLPVGPLMNFGHEGQLLLPVPVTVSKAPDSGTLEVELTAEWLVCKDVCIPQSGEFRLAVPVQAATAMHGARFDAALAQRPQSAAQATATARIDGSALDVQVGGLPAPVRGKPVEFFPEQAGVIDNAAPVAGRWDGDVWRAAVALSPQRTESPDRMAVVLVAGEASMLVDLAIQGPWPAAAPAPAALPAALPDAGPRASSSPVAPTTPSAAAWVLAIALALLGGALLNLMPCVFPVLSLKVVGFASQAHDRKGLLAGGLAYMAGVVASFLLLAGVLIALRMGGEQVGWGFQLQSPAVVAVLIALFTIIGLNLAGLFEFGSVLPSGAAGVRMRHPLADHALTGVLAVAVASPCTAPFMGASLGAAATMPPLQALAVFGALGVGMALPYVAATAWPRLASWMPRPGPWMVHFKTVMAFPMFATVVWLLWVLGQQAGTDAVAAMLGLLVALAFVIWAVSARDMAPRARTGFSLLSAGILLATASWALPQLREAPAAPSSAAAATGNWERWSAARVSELNAKGVVVFVDYTAAWCVTCQYNKRAVLSDATLLADFDLHGVALMRADWTRRDAAISAELARLGRNGVPVYAIYRGPDQPPQLLSELLTVAEVRAAIAAP